MWLYLSMAVISKGLIYSREGDGRSPALRIKKRAIQDRGTCIDSGYRTR
jgi:hypothetical protein